jgi:hypothetical protein
LFQIKDNSIIRRCECIFQIRFTTVSAPKEITGADEIKKRLQGEFEFINLARAGQFRPNGVEGRELLKVLPGEMAEGLVDYRWMGFKSYTSIAKRVVKFGNKKSLYSNKIACKNKQFELFFKH